MIELQLKLLSDSARNNAFAEALKKTIMPGRSTLSDLGSGTGFLSFIAEKYGVARCFLYEADGEMLALSRGLARENKIKNCTFIEAYSLDVERPTQTDIVISETLGNFALEEHILEILKDAQRFLKPGGIMMPQKLTQFISPVTSPRLYESIDIWSGIGFGLKFEAAREACLNNMFVERIEAADMHSKNAAKIWDTIDFLDKAASESAGTCEWHFPTAQKIYGFALWWEATVIPAVTLSTSPYSKRTHWDQIFLPLREPLSIGADEVLEVRIKSDTRLSVGVRLSWETIVKDHRGRPRAKKTMDTKRGMS